MNKRKFSDKMSKSRKASWKIPLKQSLKKKNSPIPKNTLADKFYNVEKSFNKQTNFFKTLWEKPLNFKKILKTNLNALKKDFSEDKLAKGFS